MIHRILFSLLFSAAVAFAATPQSTPATAGAGYDIYVSNERSDNVTVIDGATLKAVATIAVGKRPRGIHASADGSRVYVALSGTPIEAPPQLDANGNPVFKRDQDDDDDKPKSDKAADGIGIVDVASRQMVRKIYVGSDPEEFDLAPDAKRLYVSNEDVKTASVIDIENGKVEHIVALSQEPEGVTVSPDGRSVYVTCETGGEVFVIDAATFKVTARLKVGPRPRSVAFMPDGKVALIPSESAGQLNVVDTAAAKVIKTIALPPGSRPMHVRVAEGGNRIYVSTGRGGSVLVLDGRSHAILNNIKVGTRPWGIAISPDGKYLFSANGPSNDVSVVDLVAGRQIARVPAGASPWGVTIVPRSP